MELTFENCLAAHIRKYPALQPQDLVKYCFQAVFGAEHLALDPEAALRFLKAEFDETEEAEGDLSEPLNESYSRVNLKVWKARGLSPEKLAELFFLTATGSAIPAENRSGDRKGTEKGRVASNGLERSDVSVAEQRKRLTAAFRKTAEVLERMEVEETAPFTREIWERFTLEYLQNGVSPAHHSERFRELYAPAYRLVRNDLLAREGL